MSHALLVALNAAATRWAARPAIIVPEIPTPPPDMDQSGPITLSSNGQVVSNKIIFADTNGIVGTGLSDIVIEDCLIYFNRSRGSVEARGIKLTTCTNPIIRRCEIINAGAPDRGAIPITSQDCIYLNQCTNDTVEYVTTRRGSTGINRVSCTGSTTYFHENHDSRGPYPRGQAMQWNTCLGTHVAEDLSDEIIPGTSWAEDSYNIYSTPNVTLRRFYIPISSDGTSGRGVVVERSGAADCVIADGEISNIYNGAFGAFFSAPRARFSNVRMRGWNRYGVRGIAGSAQLGNKLCAMVVNDVETTVVTGSVYDDLPARNIDGSTPLVANMIYNPASPGSITIPQSDWTPSRSPVRNTFAWRPAAAPSYDLPPRINSFWLDGRIGTTIIPGTSILGLLPGRYINDPTSRAFQWRKNGSDISGATSIDYDVLVGDSGSSIDCVETVTNASGSYSLTTDAVAIP